MKSLFKFTLLSALIITGKLVKQLTPITAVQTSETSAAPQNPVVMTHQVLTSEPVKSSQQQSGSGMFSEMF